MTLNFRFVKFLRLPPRGCSFAGAARAAAMTTATKNVFRQKSALASSAEMLRDVKSFEDVPSPPGLPIFGHLHLIMKKENAENMVGFFNGLQAKYGNIVRPL